MALQMCLGSTELSNEKLLLPRTYFPVLTTFQMKAEIRRIRPHCGCIHPGKCFLTKLSVLHLLLFNIIILGGHNFFPKEVLVSAISYRKKKFIFSLAKYFFQVALKTTGFKTFLKCFHSTLKTGSGLKTC